MSFKRFLCFALCFVLLSLSLFSCAKKNDNTDESANVRTFKAVDTAGDSYCLIKQDEYGKIHEWKQYDNDGNHLHTLDYVYDGNLVTEVSASDAEGNVLYTLVYTIDENGKYVTRNAVVSDETQETVFMMEDDGSENYEFGIVYVTYDELGRVVKYFTRYGEEEEEVTVTTYNSLGFESETTYINGEEVYKISLTLFEE